MRRQNTRPLRIADDAQVARLESEIDAMNADAGPPAQLHSARWVDVVCAFACLPHGGPSRRAVLSVELATMEAINPAAVKYLNRLSDWFFVAARVANDGQ